VNALLDAQGLLYYALNDPRLTKSAARFIADPANQLYLSTVTIWEIVIKAQSGKLKLHHPVEPFVDLYTRNLGLIQLDISRRHILSVSALPLRHTDPFDRLLIAQAASEGFAIVTGDEKFDLYSVQTIW